jgi:hypothetical protein
MASVDSARRTSLAGRRDAAFEAFRQLGDDQRRGAMAISELFSLIIAHATERVIKEHDAERVLQSFLAGAGAQAEATKKKLHSHIRQLIRASLLKDVKFADTVKRAISAHEQLSRAKRPRRLLSETRRQLIETLVSMARLQLKQTIRPLSDSQVKECLRPFPSNKPKPAPIARMIKSVRWLSVKKARQLLAALEDRMGIERGPAAPYIDRPDQCV